MVGKRTPVAPATARGKGLDLLARREHSRRELATKLGLRGFDAAEIDDALESLRAQGCLSDERFAASLARQRSGQGYGPRRIAAELRSHGVADAEIRAAIDELDADWPALAAAQLRRRHGKAPAGAPAERARRAAFLLRRGYDAATVRAVTRDDVDGQDTGLD